MKADPDSDADIIQWGQKQNIKKEAGAELCQAKEKLGLAKVALPCKKLCRLFH